jgi:tripartite motif-containing protein 71
MNNSQTRLYIKIKKTFERTICMTKCIFSMLAGTGEKDGAALSSWARYLKNKYGNRSKENAAKDNATAASASSSSTRRLSLGLPLRSNSTVVDSSDDDQKNMHSSPTSHTIIEAGES